MKLFGKKKEGDGHRPKNCPNCGCSLDQSHWRNCPRCQEEIPRGSGCGGCGACGS